MVNIIHDVKANEQVYESLRAELERTNWGQWAVIVKGKLVAVAPIRDEALQQAGRVPHDALSRLVRKVGEELPKVVRKRAPISRSGLKAKVHSSGLNG